MVLINQNHSSGALFPLMSHRSFVWICLLPLAAVTAAFFLLPMARLVVTGAEGPQGLAGYLAILTEPRYRATLINTMLLAAATTVLRSS